MSVAGAPLRARRVRTSGAEAPLRARSSRTSGLGAPPGAKAMEDVWSVSPTQGQECEDVWSGSPIQQAPWEESMHAPPPLLRAKNVRTSRTEAPIMTGVTPTSRFGPDVWGGSLEWERTSGAGATLRAKRVSTSGAEAPLRARSVGQGHRGCLELEPHSGPGV